MGRIAVIAGIFALVFALPGTALADDIDIRDAMEGRVQGLTVRVNGSGLGYYGDSLRTSFVNTTGQPIHIKVPIGLRFLPNDSGVQTMIAAGGETIVVPPGDSEALLKAFCGEMHDSAPGAGDVFTAGGIVTGDLLSTVRNLNRKARFDATGNSAVWSLTDGLELDGDPEAQRLVKKSTSAARTAAGGAIAGGVIAGGAIIQARAAGTGKRPTAPAPVRGDVLVDAEAAKWLVADGAKTMSHNGKTYVLPPPRLPPHTNGVAYDTITVNGVEVIDDSKLAVIPHQESVEPATTPPPPPPATTTTTTDAAAEPATSPDSSKGGKVLSKAEQQHIVDWGIKNQRTPDEIQKDLDSQNQSQGGSGPVVVAEMPVRLKLPQGDVTVTAAEARAYQNQVDDIKSHDEQMKATRRELVWSRQQIEKWVEQEDHVVMRWAGGMFELFKQRNRMENPAEYLRKLGGHASVDEMLAKEYKKPQYSFDYDKWQAEVRRWEQGPDGARYREHCSNISAQARDTIRQMTSQDPRAGSLTGPFNRASHHIEVYNKHRETLIEGVRVVNDKKAALREMERQFAERIKRAP